MLQTLSLASYSRISRKYLNGSMKKLMILNPDKCYFLTLGFQDAQPNFSYTNITIKNVLEEKILGITIDKKLTFKSYLKNICAKKLKNLMQLLEQRVLHHPFKGKLC